MYWVEVKTSRVHSTAVFLLGIFFVPVSVLNIVSGFRRGLVVKPLVLGLMMLVLYGALLWLVRRGYSRSVKYLTSDGLVRNDGRMFKWAELSRVVYQIKKSRRVVNKTVLWRTEIQFKDGESAWVLPWRIANYQEVTDFVARLPCEHAEINV